MRLGTVRDLDRSAEVLAAAFNNAPVPNYIVRQDKRRADTLRLLFRSALKHRFLVDGEVHLAEAGEGVACWLPPGGSAPTLVRNLRMRIDAARYIGVTRLRRVNRALHMIETRHPTEPHYYLAYIGVQPTTQGQGVGSALLTFALQRADSEGSPTHLQTANPRNLPLYERYHFRITDELDLPDGPTVWFMWRDPVGG